MVFQASDFAGAAVCDKQTDEKSRIVPIKMFLIIIIFQYSHTIENANVSENIHWGKKLKRVEES